MVKRMSVAIAACMLIAAVAATTLTAAAPGKKQGARQEAAVQRMTVDKFATALNLTEAQTQQVNAVIASLKTDVKATFATDMTREDKLAAVLQLRSAAKQNIAAVLTDEQRQNAESSRMIDKLLRPRAAVNHQKLMAKLDLSPQQQTQIKAIIADTAAKIKALREDATLTPEAKKARAQELRQSTKDSISALLTPEQRDKFLRWRQSRPAGMHGKGICPMECKVGQNN